MTRKCKQRDAATFAATFCLIVIRVAFFCRPAATAVRDGAQGASRSRQPIHSRARLREGHAPRAGPGASRERWEGDPGRRSALTPPPHRRFPLAKARLSIPTQRDGGGQPPFPAPQSSAPRPARPSPAHPARGRCRQRRAVPAAPAAPGSGKSLLRLGSAGRLPPSLGRNLLRRQRRCPPAPWRRSPSPRR